MRRFKSFFCCLLPLLICYQHANAQSKKNDTLYQHFVSPPQSSFPRVWWHWMNGNITKDGIEKDLKWMKRVGIGGFQNFDAAWATPQIVKKRLAFMSPDWIDAFKYATKLADSLKLEMAISSSPGWSESGGPWVKPKDGMKKLVWTEQQVIGGQVYQGVISNPPSTTGEFQNVSSGEAAPTYYQDIVVLAIRRPDGDYSLSSLHPVVSSSSGHFTLNQLTDGDIAKQQALVLDSLTKTAWIQFAFDKPYEFKSLTIAGLKRNGTVNADLSTEKGPSLQVSDDGISFRTICHIPPGAAAEQTISFKPLSAAFFRILFTREDAPDQKSIKIAEFNLYTTTRINRVEEKAAFAIANRLLADTTSKTADMTAFNDVIDITNKLKSDDSLEWTVPKGKWSIIRFGYSLLGTTNHPASPEATGLEVDKMDSAAVTKYYIDYLKRYQNATGGLMGKSGGLGFITTDSWEAGPENWTNNLPAEFLKRRGYELTRWLPVLLGHIINSSEASEKFLFDFRKTLSELVAEYHYDHLTKILNGYNLKRYTESHEVGRALIADGMDIKRSAAVPMSAMWTPGMWAGPAENYIPDVLESASVAHIYGQNLVAAESFTAFGNAWGWSPEKLKPTADLELSCGLNRFVIHTSVHQPVDDKIPGLGLGPFGQWFNRHETWSEQASAWMTYLSRSSYMLQQGTFVADVVYYYGEDNNITSLFRHRLPDVPEGYKYDFVNTDALLNLLMVQGKDITTVRGMRYKVLALDSNTIHMPLNVLKKIKLMVDAGITVVGPKPISSPSLSDNPGEFKQIADQLWGDPNIKLTSLTKKIDGNASIEQTLKLIKLQPDFRYNKPDTTTKLLYVHRRLGKRDIYWVNNRTDKFQNLNCSFNVSGKHVSLWHPESGDTEPLSCRITGGRTQVPLRLQPNDAVFVVFSGHNNAFNVTVKPTATKQLRTLSGAWNLSFQKDRGAPAVIKLDSLYSWSTSTNNGVKYFSGTGTYTQQLIAPASWFNHHQQIWIDLGNVKDIAELIINGKPAGVLWNKPFKKELTGLLKNGTNTITVKVTNLWVNRLIGDQQKSATTKYTYTTEAFYQADSPLLPSGLLGPVVIYSTSSHK